MERIPYILSIAFLVMWMPIASSDENHAIEIGPMPRKATPAFQYQKITAGYQVTIDRDLSEKLLKLLQNVQQEDSIAELIRLCSKDLTDPESIALAEYIMLLIGKETPAFKKALEAKMGSEGVTIKVFGIERGKDRPLLKAIGKAFLPEETQQKAKAVMTIVRTRALSWHVEPYPKENLSRDK